jgi:hypothetical protein
MCFVAPACVAGAVLAIAAPARALPEFPGYIQEHLHPPCVPSCLLCHTCPEGGLACLKPVSLPDLGSNRGQGEFFANLVAVNGGYPRTEAELGLWLENLDNKPCSTQTNLPCDSDGDHVKDVAELGAGSDPDVIDTPGAACNVPKYGCGASLTPLPSKRDAAARGAALVAGLGLVILLVRRRRR